MGRVFFFLQDFSTSYLVISRAQNPLGTYDITYCLLNTLFSVYAAIFIARVTSVVFPGGMILWLLICCSGSKDGTNKCSVINGSATSNLFRRSVYWFMNFEGKRSLRNNWERSEDRIIPGKRRGINI
jgi:hypothetical protein